MTTQADIARHLGRTRAQVHQWVKRGCPTTSLEEAARWAGKHIRSRQRHGQESAAPAADSAVLSLPQEQALLAKARREALETEAKVRAGELCEWCIVQADVVRAAHSFRDSMLSIPGRVAAQLVGIDDEREIDRLLTATIRSELERIAGTAELLHPNE